MKIDLSKKTLLFVAGVSIQFAALFGEHALDIPLITKILAPEYYHATKGIKYLESDSSASISSESYDGFTQISKILKAYTERKLGTNSCVIAISNINVCGSEFVDKKLATSIGWSFKCKPMVFQGQLADRGTDSWSFEAVKAEVDDLKNPNLLAFCFLLFFIGTTLDVIAFRMESKELSNPIHEKLSNGDDPGVNAEDKKHQE